MFSLSTLTGKLSIAMIGVLTVTVVAFVGVLALGQSNELFAEHSTAFVIAGILTWLAGVPWILGIVRYLVHESATTTEAAVKSAIDASSGETVEGESNTHIEVPHEFAPIVRQLQLMKPITSETDHIDTDLARVREQLVEQVPCAAVFVDKQSGVIEIANVAARTALGKQQLVGVQLVDVFATIARKEDIVSTFRIWYNSHSPAPFVFKALDDALEDSEKVALEFVQSESSGHHRVVLIKDVRDRALAEAATERMRQRLRRALESIPLGILVYTDELDIVFANDTLVDFLGMSVDSFKSTYASMEQFAGAAVDEDAQEQMRFILEEQRKAQANDLEMSDAIVAFRTASDRVKKAEVRVRTIESYNHILMLRDITHELEAQQALQESETRFKQMADNVDFMIWLTDTSNNVLYVNHSFCDIFEVDEAAYRKNPEILFAHIHQHDREMFQDRHYIMERYGCSTPRELEFRISPPSGAMRWIRDKAFAIYDNEGNEIRRAGIAYDISEQKNAELQLQQALLQVQDQNQQLNAQKIKLETTLNDLKAAQSKLVQTEKMAALGQLIAGIAHEINTPLGAIQSSATTIDSILDDVLTTVSTVQAELSEEGYSAFERLVARSRQQRVSLSMKERRQLRKQHELWLEPTVGSDSRLVAQIIVNMGIDLHDSDLQVLLQQPQPLRFLEAANKIADVGNGTKNILTAAERAGKIVFALKNFSRQDTAGTAVPMSVVDNLNDVLVLYHNQLKHDFAVEKHVEDVPDIEGYPDQLGQVWTNLIQNAIQAMEGSGELGIGVKYDAIKDTVDVSITDSGKGMDNVTKAKIFEPFYTTKPHGEGTGLGLDIVKRIVSNHNGTIDVNSEVGVGTTFTVSLPVFQPEGTS